MSKSPENAIDIIDSNNNSSTLRSRLSDRFNLGEELRKEQPTMAEAVLRAANEAYDNLNAMQLRAEMAEDEARKDHLTGLLNARGFEHFVEEWANKEDVSNDTKIVIVAIDINNLKHMNDTKGHDAGNELILWVAEILKDIANSDLRDDDSVAVARMGEKADEFFIALTARDVLNDSSSDGGDPLEVIRQKIERLLEARTRTRMFAVGYSVTNRGDILRGGLEAAKITADDLMMDSKAKMKSEQRS